MLEGIKAYSGKNSANESPQRSIAELKWRKHYVFLPGTLSSRGSLCKAGAAACRLTSQRHWRGVVGERWMSGDRWCDAASGGSGSRWRNIPVCSVCDNVMPSLPLPLSLSLFSLSLNWCGKPKCSVLLPTCHYSSFSLLSLSPLSSLRYPVSTCPINIYL